MSKMKSSPLFGVARITRLSNAKVDRVYVPSEQITAIEAKIENK